MTIMQIANYSILLLLVLILILSLIGIFIVRHEEKKTTLYNYKSEIVSTDETLVIMYKPTFFSRIRFVKLISPSLQGYVDSVLVHITSKVNGTNYFEVEVKVESEGELLQEIKVKRVIDISFIKGEEE
jgi:uncharacterized protein (UPF0333 family)